MTNEVLCVIAFMTAGFVGYGFYLVHQLKIVEAREAEEAKGRENAWAATNKVHVYCAIILRRRHPVTGTNVIYVPVRRGQPAITR